MKSVARVLIVDDDPSAREWLSAFLRDRSLAPTAVGSGEEALVEVRRALPDAATLDLGLPGMNGLATLRALRAAAPGLPVVILSGVGDTQAIVEAVRLGAVDFLRKPCESEELATALDKALARSALEDAGAPGRFGENALGAGLPPLFAGQSRKMRMADDMIDHVADTDITVLIRGESGTGKELVARTLWSRSNRSRRAFVKVNCAALPHELLESELFGYEKGAFTGAQKRKLGKFELANGGTIFLDEISEMHPSLQAKLLQVLQDGQFSRLGGHADVAVDARVIAASNRNLEAAVRDGSFREDLFYRLNVVSIQLPPLRERRDEIPLLADHFLDRYAREYGKDPKPLPDEVHAAFAEYDFPGNIRELENLVKRIVVLGTAEPVLAEIRARPAAPRGEACPLVRGELERFLAGASERVSLKRVAREAAQLAEARLIAKVLERTRWNRKEAAAILQISYKALLYKMRDAGLSDSA